MFNLEEDKDVRDILNALISSVINKPPLPFTERPIDIDEVEYLLWQLRDLTCCYFAKYTIAAREYNELEKKYEDLKKDQDAGN